ncbi:MAG: hypothetical protein M3Y26_09205 [Actinomycetota bacterium]|nr:hypothetical protein [Actinomycetota bacterium]
MTADDPAGNDRRDPGDSGHPLVGTVWSRLGGVLCLLDAVVLLGFAAFYLVELARGQGDVATVVLSVALIVVVAVLLMVLARFWLAGSRRASTPTIVWNLVLVPVVYTLYSSGDTLVASAVLVVVLMSLVTGVGAAASVREA